MTKLGDDQGVREVEDRRCRWCRCVLPARPGAGRPKEFCSQRCRQWDWVARQRAHELALADGELVIARDQLDELHDELYVLACAVADTRRDLSEPMTDAEVRQSLQWLLDAAAPLVERKLSAASSP
jgi:hypothetical protein